MEPPQKKQKQKGNTIGERPSVWDIVCGHTDLVLDEDDQEQFDETGGDLTSSKECTLGLMMTARGECCIFMGLLTEKFGLTLSRTTLREILQGALRDYAELQVSAEIHALIPRLLESRDIDQIDKIWRSPQAKGGICDDCKCRVGLCEDCCDV